MKRRLFLSGCLALSLTLLAIVTTVVAQQFSSAGTSGRLNSVVTLINQGKPQEARAVISTIDKADANYGSAMCYDALCLYEVNDKRGFLKAMKSPAVQGAIVSPAIREDLEMKQIDALFFYRNFEELLPKIGEFTQRHGDSPLGGAVAEYQLVGLYERGTKKMIESSQLRSRGDVAGAEKRLQEGQRDLAQYLKLSADGRRDSYQTLTNRDFQTEAVKALTTMGGEDKALKLVAPAKREETMLAILQLHKKINSEAADDNLRRMTNFLNDFPNTKYRKRVMFDMADVALKEGWRLNWEVNQRVKAAPYLNQALGLLNGVVEDKQAGITERDVHESRVGLLNIYYAQRDWVSLSTWAAQMLTNSSPGGQDWLLIKLYDAAGLANQRKLTEAASELDELLATGFKNHPSYDWLLASAAEWRIRVARRAGDEATARRVAQQVQSSVCYDSIKRIFVKEIETLLAQPNPVSK